MTRSIFKNEGYFKNFIDEFESILSKDKPELDEKKKQRRNLRISHMHEQIFIASYSLGLSKEELFLEYKKAVKSICESWTRELVNFKMGKEQKIFDQLYVYHHDSILRLLSIGILLNSVEQIRDIKSLLVELRIRNRLFDMLIKSVVPTHELTPETESYSPTAFNKIEKIVFENPIDEKKLIKYQRTWYSTLNNNYFQWKDSHLNKGYGFSGYWNFEAAALAKISGSNVAKIYDDVFFPTDLFLDSEQITEYPLPKGFRLLFAIDSLISELGGVRRSTKEILAARKSILQYKKLNVDSLREETSKYVDWIRKQYSHEISKEKLSSFAFKIESELERIEK